MVKSLLPIAFLLFAVTNAQYNQNAPWMQELSKKQSSITSKASIQSHTIDEISASFNAYWKTRDPNKKGSGFKPFMRWKNYWEQLAYADGQLPSSSELLKSFKNKQNKSGKTINPTSNWISIGPFSHGAYSGASPGQGRVNAITVDPNNPNTWYVGAPAGGIWKTTNAGATWANLFDNFLQIGVSGIAIDPNDSNTIYISTGDDDAADSFSIGAFKSTDGGATWNATGLVPNSNDIGFLMNEITVDPSNSNIIWAATSSGLSKSEDGGVTWSTKRSGNITDFKLKPGDPKTIYAVNKFTFFVSRDGGENFEQITAGLPNTSGRLAIGVSADNSELVYVISANTGSNDYAFQGLFKSTNSGDTFTKTLNTADIFESNQAWFDLAIEVNPSNADELYIGCLNIWKSTNAGDSFSRVNRWSVNNSSYTHADIHTLKFFNGSLFCGSDGGIFVSSDNGDTFSNKTDGIAISQFYRLSVAKNNAQKMAGGLQDNSGFVRNNGEWNIYTAGDGMDYEIDPTNNNLIYGFSQFGSPLWITTNSGQSIGSISPPTNSNGQQIQGNWITPLAINTIGEVFAGFDGVYKLSGNSWEKLSSVGSANIDDLEIDPNNPMHIYAVENNTIYRSTNGGTTFSVVHSFDSAISDVAINNTDGNILYVTTSNRVGIAQKDQQNLRGVFKLTISDNTATVAEITNNLSTDQAFLSIIHQGRDANNPVYVGTNLGVYRIDDTLTTWENYFTSLPNTAISDLEISLDEGIITAATYGRGIWQSPIPIISPNNDIRILKINPTEEEVLCDAFTPEITVENNGLNTITTASISYTSNNNQEETFEWNGNLMTKETTTIPFPSFSLPDKGLVSLSVSVSIENDAYSDNNFLSNSFVANESGTENEVFSFENDEEDTLLSYTIGSTESVWERGIATENLLNTSSTSNGVYGTGLAENYPNNTFAVILSKCYNFSNLLAPQLKFKMAYDLEVNFDIVYVQYSIDGKKWKLLGSIDSQPNWYTSDRTNESSEGQDCENCPGGQWNGTNATLTEYSYDFVANAAIGETDLSTASKIMFRIVFHSDASITKEGVIIDDFYVSSFENDTDDDNDGILDVNDNCPLISNADQADIDRDGEGDVCDTDEDNDGVMNFEDNCPLTSNTNQDDFDGDGIGDLCDDDIDNDGIENSTDACPKTTLGAVIDVTGCEIFSLVFNNFTVSTKGESCTNSNNGSIEISALENFNYTATLTRDSNPIAKDFTTITSFTDLEAGDYTVCITLAENDAYKNCYSITIPEPETLSVSSKVSSLNHEVSIDFSGGKEYFITLNDEVFVTSDAKITLPLKLAENKLSVQTDKLCQGEYHETIVLNNEVFIYPNPIAGGDLTIFLGNLNKEKVELSLFSISGKSALFKKIISANENTVQLNVDRLSTGVFILNVKVDGRLLTYKIIRK